MLRALVAVIGLALCAAGIYCIVAIHALIGPGIYMLVLGAIISLGLFLEPHYRGRVRRSSGSWQSTGEKFVDPSTNKMVEVFYNAQSGEREYREVK